MALIKCPECGRDISDRANACIHCGYPIPRTREHTVPVEIEQANPAPSVEESTPVEEKPVKPPMSNKQKTIICLLVLAAALVSILIWSTKSSYDKEKRQQRDLSAAFDFSFDMTKEDVIAYEAEKYGHTEYNYDPDVNRLDFEKYDSDHWKHRYFFDDKGILKSVNYMDAIVAFGDDDEIKCNHVKPIERAILNIIGEWDSSSHNELFYYATGQVDGVKVNIQHETGASEGITVRRVEE